MCFKALPVMSVSIREDSEVQKRELVRTTEGGSALLTRE
jgi:hypothetical protein